MEKNYKRTTIRFIAITVLLFSACSSGFLRGSGDVITEDEQVSNFNRVELDGPGELNISQGDEESLSVETDDNIMPYVKAEVRGDTLYLGLESGNFTSVSPTRLIYTLTLIDLNSIKVDGSGDIKSRGIETNRLEIIIDGSGNITIEPLLADEVDVTIDGSGNVMLTGEVTNQDVLIDASGEYLAGDLRSESVEVVSDGSGDATVWVTDSLDVLIEASGSVNYFGSPTVNSTISGSGDVNRLGDK